MPAFDLNVERVLEHWRPAQAVREVIANAQALDEAALTGTADPEISKASDGVWHVRDYGRGLRHEHLTQNENAEKLEHPDRVIGKFGIGLKDALAVFDRKRIGVTIRSAHGDMTLARLPKHGFEDLRTLHVIVAPPADPEMLGTDFALVGLKDADVVDAKRLFLRYAGDEVLERTELGAVLARRLPRALIYVNGLRVATEENFLFSYDITSLTAPLRRALNRERTNVGRTAYADRVKAILLAAKSQQVADALAEDLAHYEYGTMHDETEWLDVGLHACRILNANEKVLFVTAWQIATAASAIDHALQDGYRIVSVPETLARKLPKAVDIKGGRIFDLGAFQDSWNRSFQYTFVDPADLSAGERAVFDRTTAIIRLQGRKPAGVKAIRISSTMRISPTGSDEVLGAWDESAGAIVIRRDQLGSIEAYAGTLLHELTHVRSGASDVTRDFENELTRTLGSVAEMALDVDGPARAAREAFDAR
ncbi:MAG TPA: hypothetical protein VNF73_08695 [Candidatus Saccharimonadales bacterium]|nr:hypothetical protein [Candidatus Saccharimonadales bacterium]